MSQRLMDFEKLRDVLDENAEIQGVLGMGGTLERIRPVWEQLIDGYGMQLEIQELIAKGNRVVAWYTECGTFT
jgi:hypothetical protein